MIIEPEMQLRWNGGTELTTIRTELVTINGFLGQRQPLKILFTPPQAGLHC